MNIVIRRLFLGLLLVVTVGNVAIGDFLFAPIRGMAATAEGLSGAATFADTAQAELQLELAVARARGLGVKIPDNIRFVPDVDGVIATAKAAGRIQGDAAAIWSMGPVAGKASLATIVPENGVVTVRVAPMAFRSEPELIATIAHEAAEARSTLASLGRTGPISPAAWDDLVAPDWNGIYHLRALRYEAAVLGRLR